MKKLIIFLAVLAVIFAGCSKAPEETAAAAAPAEDSKMDQLYIEVSALGNLDYFYDHKMGMEMVGKELGVRTEYVGPAEYDMNAMVSAFEQAIAKKPNGLVVVGFEPSLNSIVDKAIDQGIPVVTVDADLPGSKRLAFVGTGNYGAGVTGGHKMADLIGGSGKVSRNRSCTDCRYPERSCCCRPGCISSDPQIPRSGRSGLCGRCRRFRCCYRCPGSRESG